MAAKRGQLLENTVAVFCHLESMEAFITWLHDVIDTLPRVQFPQAIGEVEVLKTEKEEIEVSIPHYS